MRYPPIDKRIEPSNEDLGIPESVIRGAVHGSNFNPVPYNWENLIERVPDLALGWAYLLFLDGAPAMTYTFFDVIHVSIIEYQRQGKNVLAVPILNNPTEDQTDAAGFTSSTSPIPRTVWPKRILTPLEHQSPAKQPAILKE
jgi:hypothetical protein